MSILKRISLSTNAKYVCIVLPQVWAGLSVLLPALERRLQQDVFIDPFMTDLQTHWHCN